MSRFESTLVAELSGDSPTPKKTVAKLRLAAYRARKGRLSEARELIRGVREEFSALYDLQVFANINFAEAICEFFEGKVDSGIEKIRRSRVLCQGCSRDDDLPAIVAAWSATFSRIEQDWGKVESDIRQLLSGVNYISNEADCRMSLVFGDCYQEIEDYASADRYYSRARAKALSYGDESMLGAVLYNRAAIRVFNLRLSEVSGHIADIAHCGIAIEAASAENFSQYTYDSGLPGIYDLLGAQLHLLRGEFASAMKKLGDVRAETLGKDWPAVEIVRQADLLYAGKALNLISLETAKNQAREIIRKCPNNSCFGDVAITAFTLSKAFVASDESLCLELLRIAREALDRHIEDRTVERSMLARLEVLNASR